LEHVAPSFGTGLPYYFQAGAGQSWHCVQLNEKRHDKIDWIDAHKFGRYRHCKVRRRDGGIIVSKRDPFYTIFTALDALLQ
jgi:hypothetical protein